MSEVNSLEVLIQANTDQFRRELDDVKKRLGSLGDSADKVSRSVGGNLVGSILKANIATAILTKTVSTLSKGIFNMGKQVVNLGTQYTRLKTATNTVTRNLGITAAEVENLRNQLEESNTYGSRAEEVIRTLATSGLVDLARSLEAVDARTGDTIEGVGALVLTMKDLAASAGIDSADGINRLTQFINEGNIAATRGIMTLGRMNIEYSQYARELGKTVSEMTGQEQAQVRMNIVMREGEKAFGTYADTMQTAGKAMGSIRDASISLYERLGNYLEPVFASVTRAGFLFVDGLRQALIQNAETFRQWANRVAAYVVAVIRILGSILTRIPVIGKNFQQLADFALKPVQRGMDSLTASAGGTSQAMEDTADSAKKLRKELLGLTAFDEMNVLRKPEEGGGVGGVGGMGIGGLDLSEMIKADELNESIDSIMENVGRIEEKMKGAINKIREFFQPLIDVWNEHLKPAWEELKAVLGELWESIMDIEAKEFLLIIGEIIGFIVIAAVWVLIKALTGLAAIVKWVIDRWKQRWDDAIDAIAKMILWVEDFKYKVKEAWEKVKEWVSNAVDEIQKKFEKFRERVKEIWGELKEWVLEKWGGIAEWFDVNVTTPISNFFSNMWKNVKSGASDAWEGIKNTFKSIPDWFRNKFSDAWTKVKNVFSTGGSVWRGIKEGIENAFKNIVNRLISGVNTIISIPFNAINRMLTRIKNISILGMQPFKWLIYNFSVPRIPALAQGGVIESPTVAMIGEAGKEVVLPLENNTEWMDKLADKIGGGGMGTLVVKIGDDTIYEKAIDYIKDKGLRTGTNLLNL